MRFDNLYDRIYSLFYMAMGAFLTVALIGAVMAALGILESMLGFDETMLSLMIALYLAQDSFGTACNVTGDAAIALLVDGLFGKKQKA